MSKSTQTISNKASSTIIPTTYKSDHHNTIYGITVQGTGLPIDISELEERKASLASVRKIEEQERQRRVKEDWDLDNKAFVERASYQSSARTLEEDERKRRTADLDGSEEYRQLLANKVSASIAKDILTPTLRMQKATNDLLSSAKQAGQDFFWGAGNLAYRAAQFFGGKASHQLHEIQDQAYALTGKVSEFSNQAYETAAQKAHSLVDQVTNKAQDTYEIAAEKTTEQMQNLSVKAQNLGDQVKEKTTEAVQNLGDKVQGISAQVLDTAVDLKEKAVHFGDQSLEDAKYFLTISKLNYLEEAERTYRTTVGLNVEKFILALHTSDLVRDFLVAYDRQYSVESEANRWYAISVLEEFERARRLSNRSDKIAQKNANQIAKWIHLHNIKKSSYRPQPSQIKKMSDVLVKKVQVEDRPAQPTRAMAAM